MASRFWVGGSGNWDGLSLLHWAATSGGVAGVGVVTPPGSSDTVTFDANSGGGTVTVTVDVNVQSITCGAFTGTLDFVATNPTMQSFTASGTGVRTLSMGTGNNWYITGNNTTVFTLGTTTNLTLTATTCTLNFTYAGSTGTRTIGGSGTTFKFGNLKVSAGSDILNFGGSTVSCLDLDFTGFSGTWGSAIQLDCKGNLTLSPTMLRTYTGLIVLSNTSGTKNIDTQGIVLASTVTQSGVGGTTKLLNNLNIGTSVLTITQGNFDNNGKSITCGRFSSSNSNTRDITLDNATINLGGTGTVLDLSVQTGLTLHATNGIFNITDTSNTAITFAGGSKVFGKIQWNRGASTATNTMGGSSTFNDGVYDLGTAAHVIALTGGSTVNATNYSLSGSLGNILSIQSTNTTPATLVKAGGGTVSCDYVNVSYITGSPDITFYMGANSTDGGNNIEIYFTPVPVFTNGNINIQRLQMID